MFLSTCFIYYFEALFQSCDRIRCHIRPQCRVHFILIQSHNIIFQRIVCMEMDFTYDNIPRTAPASSKAQMDLPCFHCFIKFYNIKRIIMLIPLLYQMCINNLLLVWVFLVPIPHSDRIGSGLLIRCRKRHIIHLIILIKRHDHSFRKARISYAVIPV